MTERRWTPLLLIAAMTAGMVVRTWLVWPELPPRMASHFDAHGNPNGFQSRDAFFGLIFGMTVLMGVIFGGMSLLLRIIPPHLINLPHREYWLQPERFAEAIERFGVWSAWFGVATVGLLVGILELTLRANLHRSPLDPTLTWLLLGSYLAVTVVSMVSLHRSFRPPR